MLDSGRLTGDPMRNALYASLAVLVCGSATFASVDAENTADASPASQGGLQIEIQSPSADFSAVDGETIVEVEGIASAIGGVRYLDMMFVMDTSKSLRSTDPDDFRSSGAIGLVESLSPKSDIQIGVVSFDSKAQLAQPLTSDRNRVADAIRNLSRSGSTNLGAGIVAALHHHRAGEPDGGKEREQQQGHGRTNAKFMICHAPPLRKFTGK